MSLHFAKCIKFHTRAFSCSSTLNSKQWRSERGLPANRNAEGILTDGPDYTFLDGRPTPLLKKQKVRWEKQQWLATKIIECNAELAHAKERYQNLLKEEADERQRVITGRLKPKGNALNVKKTS